MICDICGIEEYLPFTCSHCGGKFCSKHRLPERHNCSRPRKRQWGRGIGRTRDRSPTPSKPVTHQPRTRKKENHMPRKKHREIRIFIKILFVIGLLCGGLMIGWKNELFPDEINQKIGSTIEYTTTTIERIFFEKHINVELFVSPDEPCTGENITIAIVAENPTENLETLICYINNEVFMEIVLEQNQSKTETFYYIPNIVGEYNVSLVHNTKCVEYEIITVSRPPLKEFTSVNDLIGFLDDDGISDVIYETDFTCGDFAEALVDSADYAGYRIDVYSMWDSELEKFKQYVESLEYTEKITGGTRTTTFSYGYGSGHAVCKAEIGSDTYIIEPQSDMIFRIIGSGYEIIYFGEVTK